MRFTEARAKYKALEETITFEEATAIRDGFERELRALGAVLKSAPRLANGLVLDKDKTPEYRAAFAQYDTINTEYRGFTEMYARRFKKQLREASYARRNGNKAA